MFWDADLWMIPALALLDAPASAAVTGFRGRTLDMAKRNAGLYGLQGAMYPWETATNDGHDACVAGSDWSEQRKCSALAVAWGVLCLSHQTVTDTACAQTSAWMWRWASSQQRAPTRMSISTSTPPSRSSRTLRPGCSAAGNGHRTASKSSIWADQMRLLGR